LTVEHEFPTANCISMKTPNLLSADRADSIALATATQFSPSGIVSRTLLSAGATRVVLFGFAAGQELTEHASPARALVQMLTGSAEWKLAGETRILGPGELLHMPPGLPHAVRALEQFSMLLTLIKDGADSTKED
jgi:quercetin dioxygenase-like cupin family protein